MTTPRLDDPTVDLHPLGPGLARSHWRLPETWDDRSDVARPDLSDAARRLPRRARSMALDRTGRGIEARHSLAPSGLDRRDRRRRPHSLDSGPRGPADRPRPGSWDAGLRDREDITVSVGVGRHHAVDSVAMRRRVGDAVADAHALLQPAGRRPERNMTTWDDPAEGVPVRVFPAGGAKADVRVLIGSVLPHLQAGFGGGYKLIFPGTSHRTDAGGVAPQGFEKRPGGPAARARTRSRTRCGGRSGRPSSKLGPCVSISHLLGPPGTILHVASGHPDPVQDRPGGRGPPAVPGPRCRPVDRGRRGRRQRPLAGRPDDELQGPAPAPRRRPTRRRSWRASSGPTRSRRSTAPSPCPRSRGSRPAVSPRGLGDPSRTGRRPTGSSRALHAPSEFLDPMGPRELVVDRTVLVYAPPLFDRIGPRSRPDPPLRRPGPTLEGRRGRPPRHAEPSMSRLPSRWPHLLPGRRIERFSIEPGASPVRWCRACEAHHVNHGGPRKLGTTLRGRSAALSEQLPPSSIRSWKVTSREHTIRPEARRSRVQVKASRFGKC